MKKKWWLKLLLILAGCSAMALFVSFQLSKGSETRGIAVPIMYFFPFLLFDFLGWGIMALFMPRICRKLQEWIPRWSLLFTSHILLGILMSAVHLIVIHKSWIFLWFRLLKPFSGTAVNSYPLHMYQRMSMFQVVIKWLDYDLLIYMAIVGFVYFYDNYHMVKEKEIKTSQLRAQLAQAQLVTLKTQLQPHFLFNALNTISAYVYESPEMAVKMIAGLSRMLRFSFSNHKENEIPVASELRLLNLYLEIEQARYQERLRITRAVEPEVDQALVPALLLQPLVENAIRHGISREADGGEIVISARRNGPDGLLISVADDGPGFQGDAEELFLRGIGLKNTRERLRILYGDRQSLTITNGSQKGFAVRITLPLKTAAGPDGARPEK
ncbi:MAG: histidine kinase [Candidatus Aminicenantes bacterium]|nr:histidine kinase [Candidatus Aminicenantes bacterium]